MLFIAGHQIDVELGDAGFAKALEFFAVLFDGPDEAEAVDYFVADEIRVVAADFAMVVIVVIAAVLNEGSERRRAILPVCISQIRSIT